MGYFLRSVQEEYDHHGNYIGNSPNGNQFHGVAPATTERILICAACGSARRRNHIGGGTVCADCNCSEAQYKYR